MNHSAQQSSACSEAIFENLNLPISETHIENQPFPHLFPSTLSYYFYPILNKKFMKGVKNKKWVGLACASRPTKRRVARLGGKASAKSRAEKRK